MPKIPRELSPLEVSRLKSEGAHAVGGVSGLYLQVLGGSCSWVLRFVVAGRRRRMGLGPFPAVTLALVKEKARAAHQEIDQGIDPIQARNLQVRHAEAAQAKVITFKKACELLIASREAEWKNSALLHTKTACRVSLVTCRLLRT